jgi:hypothetical protein
MPVRILHMRTVAPPGELLRGVCPGLASGETRIHMYRRRKVFPVYKEAKQVALSQEVSCQSLSGQRNVKWECRSGMS